MTAVFAHRGCHDACRENTLGAFAEARRQGADGVELDVRLGADGSLVVHHDPVIPGAGPVADLVAADLPPDVPLLAAAIEACGDLVVNVEVKTDGAGPTGRRVEAIARAVVEAVAEPARGRDRVIVSSFDRECLQSLHRADPDLPLGLLVGWTADPRAALREAVDDGFAALHPFVSQVDRRLVEGAHRAGLTVNVWTVNAEEDLRSMVGLGVDGVITDRLGPALAVARVRDAGTGPVSGNGA
jgi:glycerophosphoryl diester phosphodiesterase